MKIPTPPKPIQISSISPSLYEDVRTCKARAAWSIAGERTALPGNAKAILGSCFHEVLAKAQKGLLPVDEEMFEVEAAKLFDATAEKKFDQSHPIIRAKFRAKEFLPEYYLQRASAVVMAKKVRSMTSPAVHNQGKDNSSTKLVERYLVSQDEQINGRPDYLDSREGVVVDYKTRRELDSETDEMTDREKRQLRLYAYLARQNGIDVRQCVIALSNGNEYRIEISEREATVEANAAHAALAAFNAAITEKTSFEDLAAPSVENCKYCPCAVLCKKYWEVIDQSWGETFGTHLQAKIISEHKVKSQNINLLTLDLEVTSATFPVQERITLEQIPEDWIFIDQQGGSIEGGTIRVFNLPVSTKIADKEIFRVNRLKTEIWIIPAENHT